MIFYRNDLVLVYKSGKSFHSHSPFSNSNVLRYFSFNKISITSQVQRSAEGPSQLSQRTALWYGTSFSSIFPVNSRNAWWFSPVNLMKLRIDVPLQLNQLWKSNAHTAIYQHYTIQCYVHFCPCFLLWCIDMCFSCTRNRLETATKKIIQITPSLLEISSKYEQIIFLHNVFCLNFSVFLSWRKQDCNHTNKSKKSW